MKSLAIILAGVLLVAADCRRANDECHKTIIFRNESNQPVYFCKAVTHSENSGLCRFIPIGQVNQPTGSGSILEESTNPYCWEETIAILDRYERYVIEPTQSSFTGFHPCDSINQLFNVLQQYSFTLQEMQAQQFVITYP